MPPSVASIFAIIDTRNAAKFASYFHPAGIFRFANADLIHGPEAVQGAVEAFFDTIGGLSHRIIETYEVGDTVIVKTEVSYTRKNGKVVTLPNCDVIVFEGDMVKEWLIYIDLGPLYADE